jgi:deazaflavin-dependent oxidoreductase (nitroreductase family)
VFLTTTGAKSGLPRTAPLFGIPIDGSLGLIGSNYGEPSHPGWVRNLEADPRAKLRYRQTVVDVVADRAGDALQEQIWAMAIQMYAGFARYRAKAGRDIRVFVARPD